MIDIINNLGAGFATALTFQNLIYCAIGCIIGTVIGLLPGLGPIATISLLLPFTYSLPTTGAIIMLAGIYYGAQYGDSVSAITMKIPHVSSVIACIDGYQMHLKGKTGLALFTAGVSSFIGGTVAAIVVAGFAPMLGDMAFLFGPAEYCMLMLMGFVCVSLITTGDLISGLGMVFIGVLLGSVGTDVNSGVMRFTMGLPFLADGIGMISIAIGCFGLAEIVSNLDKGNTLTPFNGKIKLMPTWPEFCRIIPSALRGSIVGSILGLLPGGGPTMAQYGAYAVDKKLSKYREEIGFGAIEGVAGQASADEAAARTSFIPLMSLGIPENAVMALIMGALMIKGIVPGPQLIDKHPELFWGLIASMWIGNVFLLILNVPLVRFWLSIFKIPYGVLFPCILFFCCIGTFSTNNNLQDIYTTAVFGVMGYVFLNLGLEGAPLMLGFILGPMLEENFRREMLISRGDFSLFWTRPISCSMLVIICLFIIYSVYSTVRKSCEIHR
jgi:putative tricarboxylic transport membrane protein